MSAARLRAAAAANDPATRDAARFASSDRVGQVFPMAVGACAEALTLYLSGTAAEYSTVANQSSAAARSEQVRSVDLRTTFELCRVDGFDLAKIDIEGGEAQLLQSASDADLQRLRHRVLEWHYTVPELEKVVERFRRLGFQARALHPQGQMPFMHAVRR